MAVSTDVFIVGKSSGGADRLTEKTDQILYFFFSHQFLSGPVSDIFFVVCILRVYANIMATTSAP